MNATECFSLSEEGRVLIDGVEWVLYNDTVFTDAIPAAEYDNVDLAMVGERTDDTEEEALEHNCERYSLWCAETRTADPVTLALILALLRISHVNSAAHGGVDALGMGT